MSQPAHELHAPAIEQPADRPITFLEMFGLLTREAEHKEAMQAALVREHMRRAPDARELREARVLYAAATLVSRMMDDQVIRARLAELADDAKAGPVPTKGGRA